MGLFIPGRFIHRLALDSSKQTLHVTTYRMFGSSRARLRGEL
jgi:hypothetical protein